MIAVFSYSLAPTFLDNCWSLEILWSSGQLAVQSALYCGNTHFLHVIACLIEKATGCQWLLCFS